MFEPDYFHLLAKARARKVDPFVSRITFINVSDYFRKKYVIIN